MKKKLAFKYRIKLDRFYVSFTHFLPPMPCKQVEQQCEGGKNWEAASLLSSFDDVDPCGTLRLWCKIVQSHNIVCVNDLAKQSRTSTWLLANVSGDSVGGAKTFCVFFCLRASTLFFVCHREMATQQVQQWQKFIVNFLLSLTLYVCAV